MTGVTVDLLGRPQIIRATGEEVTLRSRKSWAVLAYILLDHAQPTRTPLASLLFAEADDPLRALRWSLAEIRRGLGDGASIGGNPVLLGLPEGSVVDVQVLTSKPWQDAVHLSGLGGELLDGVTVHGAPTYESWLLCEQHRLRGATEAVLHEAELGSMSHGETERALDYAVRATSMNPLDENHHALVIRLYRLMGNLTAAEQQRRRCAKLLDRELGTSPGPCIEAAIRETPEVAGPGDVDTVAAIIEKGEATVAAGAADTGIQSLRGAVVLADRGGEQGLRVRSRLVLAEALIHASGGLD
ncbi:MAG: BTAD domain-containing putative transcriptional regulator, partial [Ornithinimicrobium sp.]